MTEPVRIQLSRKKGFNLQEHSRALNGLDAVNCARPGKWGNPYKAGDVVRLVSGHKRSTPRTLEEAVYLFRVRECVGPKGQEIVRELRGKNLACFCAPGALCHADVLLEIANKPLAAV